MNKVEFSLSYSSHPTPGTILTQRNVIFDQGNWPKKKLDFKTSLDYKMLIIRLQKPEDDLDSSAWKNFITNGRQLEILVHDVFLTPFIRNLKYFEHYVEKCSRFLRIVELMSLSVYQTRAPYIENPADLALFKVCV